MNAQFSKILIANRGEIAVRVMRTCRELGIKTVAVYSDADRGALHVRHADEAYPIGPSPSAQSYLRADVVLQVAKESGAEAIHPGYGFLSENAAFARACEAAEITFIGPSPEAIEAMGHKTRARRIMSDAGVPVVPGAKAPLATSFEALEMAREIGFPVMLKAAAGGGGKGMRRVDDEAGFVHAFEGAVREAESSFGDGAMYLEKFLEKPRHVEVQIFGDKHGNACHLFERECSVQRRHQKIIEESPSCIVDDDLRAQMGAVAVQAAHAVNYSNAGTVEFLVDAHRNFYFLEMNTRLQVEHPVTEWVTGTDLVAAQLAVAAGATLPFKDLGERPRGHAIEARIYAEDPWSGFLPSPGRIARLRVPEGPYVRNDSGVFSGMEISPYYDPTIAKLTVWGATREEAIERLDRALGEYIVHGVSTNIAFLRRVLANAQFRSGEYDTGLIDQHISMEKPTLSEEETRLAAIAAALFAHQRAKRAGVAEDEGSGVSERGPSAWRRVLQQKNMGW